MTLACPQPARRCSFNPSKRVAQAFRGRSRVSSLSRRRLSPLAIRPIPFPARGRGKRSRLFPHRPPHPDWIERSRPNGMNTRAVPTASLSFRGCAPSGVIPSFNKPIGANTRPDPAGRSHRQLRSRSHAKHRGAARDSSRRKRESIARIISFPFRPVWLRAPQAGPLVRSIRLLEPLH